MGTHFYALEAPQSQLCQRVPPIKKGPIQPLNPVTHLMPSTINNAHPL